MILRQTGAWAWLREISFHDVIARIQGFGPWVFFGALAVLPAFGMPVMPFHLVAAKTFGLPLALTAGLLAVAANVAICYGLARSVMHPVIESLLRRMGREVPRISPQNRWLVTVLLRVTPGPPFFAQSYLLALGGVPFGIYMIVSVAVSWTYGAAFIIFGETLLSGSASKLITGVVVVIAVVVIIRLLRQRLEAKAAAALAASGSDPVVKTTHG